MTDARRPSLTVSAQHLAPGQGGIGRVARLTIKALADVATIRALSSAEDVPVEIDGVRSVPFHDSRWRFVLANTGEVLRGRRIIYDFPGTARAHLFGRLFGSRYAVWIHGYDIWGPLRPDYVRAVQAAEIVLVNSNYTLKRAQSHIGALPNARVCTLGTEEDEAPAPQAAQEGPPTLLFVGRSDELFGKGQDLLIDVWPDIVAKLPEARLVFAGGGPALGRLRELAQQSSARANIDVLGFVAEEAMPALWRRATAFAMLGCHEGFGLVFVEAMRYGLPVIASTDDASCEVNVDGVTGFNVSRSDRAGLADRILSLMSDPERAAQFGRAGFQHWQNAFRFSAFKARLQAIVRPWLLDQSS